MPATIAEFLVMLSGLTVVWAVSVCAAMAVTAVILYFFWDLVGRGISLVSRALNIDRSRQRG